MSGVYEDIYRFVSCSGVIMSPNMFNYTDNYTKKYSEIIQCEYCRSLYSIDEKNTRCPSCGASYQKKQTF